MSDRYDFKFFSFWRILSILLLLFTALPGRSASQFILVPENMSMGGGGTAYLTGFETLSVNPANLFIREKNYRIQTSILQCGIYYDSLLPQKDNIQRFRDFHDRIQPFSQSDGLIDINAEDRQALLDRNYPRNNKKRQFLSSGDIYWFGIKWTGADKSYAIAMRTRKANRYTLGRALFSNALPEDQEEPVLDKSFKHSVHTLHEISFGYAEPFRFLSGLMPQLSRFIIGIAPKVVFPGSVVEAEQKHRVRYSQQEALWVRELQYQQFTTGALTEFAEANVRNAGHQPPLPAVSLREMLRPAGFGVGLDVGITYLVTFGEDLSVLRGVTDLTQQSLRISLSVTDLGAVFHAEDAMGFESRILESRIEQPAPVSNSLYTGNPNQHYSFLSQFDEFGIIAERANRTDQKRFSLPTAINAGALFQYKRLKLAGDLSLAVTDSPFTHQGLSSYFGAEVRPLPFLPLRAGTRFAKEMTGFYSFGTGIETNRVDIDLAMQLKSKNAGPTAEILAAALLGVKVYIP
ncbi:MAG: hypothetical protein GVY20_08350 [Bacteroidetes bacterium]|jgi:hypothetical protein|nr:hypothetical protein [Bacteroidota bacterium]